MNLSFFIKTINKFQKFQIPQYDINILKGLPTHEGWWFNNEKEFSITHYNHSTTTIAGPLNPNEEVFIMNSENGPARFQYFVRSDASRMLVIAFINEGQMHNIYGPACLNYSIDTGRIIFKDYYINGKRFSIEQFYKQPKVVEAKLNKILSI